MNFRKICLFHLFDISSEFIIKTIHLLLDIAKHIYITQDPFLKKKQCFHFRIVLDLHKNCNNGTKFLYISYPVSPAVNIFYLYYIYLFIIKKEAKYTANEPTNT
jgi:hypothetical protein